MEPMCVEDGKLNFLCLIIFPRYKITIISFSDLPQGEGDWNQDNDQESAT